MLFFKWLIFLTVLIYTLSFAFFEWKNGNKTGGASVVGLVIFSLVLFVKYLK